MAEPAVNIEPVSLQLLLSVADLGSISKAARRHGLTQPSASRRIRDLERRLGIRLLARTATGAELTTDGTQLLTHCRAVVEVGDDLLAAASAIRAGDSLSVALAATPTVTRFDLPALCSTLVDQQPNVELKIATVETIEAANGVREGRFELAIVDGPLPPLGLSDHLLTERPLAVAVGQSHLWWSRTAAIAIDELLSTPVWLPPTATGMRDVVDEAVNLAGATTTLQPAGQAGDDIRLAQAILGRYPAIVRGDYADGFSPATDGRQVHLVPTKFRLTQPVRLIWKGRQPGSGAAFQLWHHLRSTPPWVVAGAC